MWSWHSERETGGFLQDSKYDTVTLDRKDMVYLDLWKSSMYKTIITYFNRKSWREFQGYEVSQTCKVRTCSCHEVNNRSHLLHQGEGMILTHPQGTFKPSWYNSDKWKTTNKLYVDMISAAIMLCVNSGSDFLILSRVQHSKHGNIHSLSGVIGLNLNSRETVSYFCVRMLISMGRPMSLLPRSKSESKYSSGVMAVGLVAVAYSIVMSYNSGHYQINRLK